MNTRLILRLTGLITLFTLGNVFADDVVTVTFSGTLLAKSCDVKTASKDQTVYLGTYDANDFLNVGDVSPAKQFAIELEGCPTASSMPYSSGVSANVTFSGEEDTDNSALLKLTAGQDAATGVGVEILDNQDLPIALNGNTGFRELTLNAQGDARLDFKLRYKSTQPYVHAGQANALLYFDIDYQ